MNPTPMPSAPYPSPSLALLASEPVRALLDLCAAKLSHKPAHVGDGHSVVVYPGLGGGAITTSHLRTFLNRAGFKASDWGGGINTGPDSDFEPWLDDLVKRVHATQAANSGRKVSLLGWSLGGIYAREIAKRIPHAVRQVITLGTPFASLGESNHATGVFKLLNSDAAPLTPEMQEQLRQRPPVPTSSLYSKTDGIVSWRGCIEKRSDTSESVEVSASHLGMGSHPQVLRIVVNRLAQAEGRWRPLKRSERLGQRS